TAVDRCRGVVPLRGRAVGGGAHALVRVVVRRHGAEAVAGVAVRMGVSRDGGAVLLGPLDHGTGRGALRHDERGGPLKTLIELVRKIFVVGGWAPAVVFLIHVTATQLFDVYAIWSQ